MYFEILPGTTAPTDWARLRSALESADPGAELHLEPQHGRVRIDGRLDWSGVLAALRSAGFEASHLPHESGGSTCCGSCG